MYKDEWNINLEKSGNIRILHRILGHINEYNSKFLINIQKNKQNIKLSDQSTFNSITIGDHNIEKNEVIKRYEFIEKDGSILDNGGYGIYKRFICCLD